MSGRSSVCLVFTLHRLHLWRVPHRRGGDRPLTHSNTTAPSEQPFSSSIDRPFFSVTTCLDDDRRGPDPRHHVGQVDQE